MNSQPSRQVSDPPAPRAGASAVINESQLFSWILVSVIVLMFASFLAWLLAGLLISNPTTSQTDAETGASWTFFAVLGAFIGLLTGKLT